MTTWTVVSRSQENTKPYDHGLGMLRSAQSYRHDAKQYNLGMLAHVFPNLVLSMG